MDITFVVSGVVITIIALAIIIQYNILIRIRNKVRQSKSSIDVYLTQRFDLIPNLVETVKSYSKYEQEIFSKMAELRSTYKRTKNIKIGEELNNKINTFMALSEKKINFCRSNICYIDFSNIVFSFIVF